MDDEPGQQEVITVFEAYMPFLESFFTNYFTENDRLAREHPNYKDGISQLVDTCIALLEAIIAVPTFGTKKRQTDVKDVFLVWIDKVLTVLFSIIFSEGKLFFFLNRDCLLPSRPKSTTSSWKRC